MKILFVENRHKTYFYEHIAKNLQHKGFKVFWIIQNKSFIPKENFDKKIIEYPSKIAANSFQRDEQVEEIIKIDRQQNHFNKKDTTYFYYYANEIKKYLLEIQPDFVFGEATAFHELLTIKLCKELKISYLNPSTCRYPIGRFSFYEYDTLVPRKGSQEELSKEAALKIINQIINREAAPDYMRAKPASGKEVVKDKLKKTTSYFGGEQYNTPNPIVKYKKEKEKKKIIQMWDEIEITSTKNEKFVVMYPLQIQPEANIDVWGKKHRNQLKLINDISDLLPEDSILMVKPNPKSKYEMSQELLELVKKKNNIKTIPHNVTMESVLPNVDLVVTVTGTIAIECILSNKPVATLINTINNKAKNCIFIDSLKQDLNNLIDRIKSDIFYKLTKVEKIEFINVLNKTSYRGKISDPFSDGTSVSKENIDMITNAFLSVLKQ